MGIHREGEWTLVRLPVNGEVFAQIKRGTESLASVRTNNVDRVLDALRVGWVLNRSPQRYGVVDVPESRVVVSCDVDEAIIRVFHTATAKIEARVPVECTQLMASVLAADPSDCYEPVRRLQVRAGQVWIRHYEQRDRERVHRKEAAFRRVITAAGDAVVINMLNEELRK
jgi:hypothetical protein